MFPCAHVTGPDTEYFSQVSFLEFGAFAQCTVSQLQVSFNRSLIYKEMAVLIHQFFEIESPCVADLRAEPLDFKLCILLRLLI